MDDDLSNAMMPERHGLTVEEPRQTKPPRRDNTVLFLVLILLIGAVAIGGVLYWHFFVSPLGM